MFDIYVAYLIVGGWVAHMRAIWDIGVKYRGWQAPYTDHCAHHPPTKYITQSPPKIHLMKYQMVSISNYWNEEKGSDVFKASPVQNGFSLSRKDELVDQWKNEFGDYYPPVTSDSSLHLSGLGGQTDGLSLISPESVVSTHKKDPKKRCRKKLVESFSYLFSISRDEICVWKEPWMPNTLKIKPCIVK